MGGRAVLTTEMRDRSPVLSLSQPTSDWLLRIGVIRGLSEIAEGLLSRLIQRQRICTDQGCHAPTTVRTIGLDMSPAAAAEYAQVKAFQGLILVDTLGIALSQMPGTGYERGGRGPKAAP